MKYLMWLLKAAIFLTLLAFALKNQQDTAVNLFFGAVWHAPLVLVLLIAFAIGLMVGALGMVPRWWKHRREARRAHASLTAASTTGTSPGTAPHGL